MYMCVYILLYICVYIHIYIYPISCDPLGNPNVVTLGQLWPKNIKWKVPETNNL